jgi:phosphatidate cytidylyltransferase
VKRQVLMNKEKNLSNFASRMFINLLGIPAIILLARAGGLPYTVFFGLVAILGQLEFYNLVRQKGFQPWTGMGLISGIAWILVTYLSQSFFYPLLLLILLIFLLIVLFHPIPNAIVNAAVTFLGFLYLPLLISVLIILRELPAKYNGNNLDGYFIVVLVFSSIWICDALAYVFGKWLGKKHKIAPKISPGKSWAGCIAGLFGALLTVIIFYYLDWKPGFLGLGNLLIIGSITGVIGQAGDFVESAFKRDVGVKDSSTLLLGHGGMLDRFDSFLIAPGFVYLYLLIVI